MSCWDLFHSWKSSQSYLTIAVTPQYPCCREGRTGTNETSFKGCCPTREKLGAIRSGGGLETQCKFPPLRYSFGWVLSLNQLPKMDLGPLRIAPIIRTLHHAICLPKMVHLMGGGEWSSLRQHNALCATTSTASIHYSCIYLYKLFDFSHQRWSPTSLWVSNAYAYISQLSQALHLLVPQGSRFVFHRLHLAFAY